MTNKLALVVAVILGILSVVGIKAYVQQIKDQTRMSQELMPVLVASRDLAPNHLVREDEVEIANLSRSVIENAFRGTQVREKEKQTIVGARTRVRLKTGQVLTQHHFNRRDTKQMKFPPTHRAMTVPITKVAGVAGMLKPGDYVDVIVSMQLPVRGEDVAITRTLFQNKLILATDMNTNPFGLGSGLYTSLTLRLKPSECNKLVHCLAQGAVLHCTLLQEGTKPTAARHPVTSEAVYKEIEQELRKAGGGGASRWRGR